MHLFRSLFCACLVFAIIGWAAAVAAAQSVEPSYEVSLQLLVGSNEAGARGDLPRNLTSLSTQLKNTFAFSNYRLSDTLLGRVSNTGNFEYKSVANSFGPESAATRETFLDWSMGDFRSMPTAKGPQGFQIASFRFGARVPVTTGTHTNAEGKVSNIVNYESIGLSFHKVGVPENTPTLIGTLNLPGTNGTIFLVMTVKSAE